MFIVCQENKTYSTNNLLKEEEDEDPIDRDQELRIATYKRNSITI